MTRRPTALMIVATLHVMLGVTFTSTSCCLCGISVVMWPLTAAVPVRPGVGLVPPPPGEIVLGSVFSYTLWLGLAVLTFVCGLFLFQCRPWARALCVALVGVTAVVQGAVLYSE